MHSLVDFLEYSFVYTRILLSILFSRKVSSIHDLFIKYLSLSVKVLFIKKKKSTLTTALKLKDKQFLYILYK